MTAPARYAERALPYARAAVQNSKAEIFASLPVPKRIALAPVWWLVVSLLLPWWLRIVIELALIFVGRRYAVPLAWVRDCPMLDPETKADLADLYAAATAPEASFSDAVMAAVKSPATS